MFWEHLEQANERLRRSVVCYGDSPHLIEELDQRDAEVEGLCYPPSPPGNARLKRISLDDPEWNDFRKLPSLGLVNTLDGLYFIVRMPRRGMRHGLSNENTRLCRFDVASKIFAGADLNLSQFFMEHSLFWEMSCKDDFPTFEECLENTVVGDAVAFSRKHFLCRREKSVFEMYREETQIGLVVRDQPILYSNKRFFREELEQVYGLRNIQEKGKMNKQTFLKAYKEKHEKKTKKALNFPVPNISPERPLFKKSTPGDIGLEIEVEGRRLPRPNVSVNGVSWVVHNDGSLRGGVEYVLSGPCLVDDVPELTNKLWDSLQGEGVRLNNSNRTSTHVHVNIQGMKLNSLTSYFLLWMVYEQALIRWCGKARTSNHFCLSNQDCANFLGENWLNSLKEGGFHVSGDYRYSALNLNAMTKFNSFEFRCLDGITDPNRVINWVKLLWALKQEALDNMKTPSYLVNVLSELSPYSYLEDIFHRRGLDMAFFQQIVSPYVSYREFNSECFTSFRDVQEICFVIDWDNWKDEFEKDFYDNPFASPKTIEKRIYIDNEAGRARPVRPMDFAGIIRNEEL